MGRNADGNRVGDGNGDVNLDGDMDGAGRRTGMETNEGPHSRNGIGSGYEARRVEESRICPKQT